MNPEPVVAKMPAMANHRGTPLPRIPVVPRRCVVVVFSLMSLCAWASPKSADTQPASGQRQAMTQQTRFYVIRGLQSEIAFARKPFPMGTKGLTLREDGTITPSGNDLEKALAMQGPSVKPGDRVRITQVRIARSFILFEINGGPLKKKKWYDHIDVGVGGMGIPTMTQTQQTKPENPRGTLLILAFKNYVPEIAPDALKEMLNPVLDFSSKSAAEAYLDTIPLKAKLAIQNHEVLVGMDQDMVIYSKGRPEKKIRENDEHGKPYEEWIYGQPPEDVEFVRFNGIEVVQVKIMKVDGEKIVRTEKEVDLKEVREAEARKQEQQQQQAAKPQPVANRPTLRRPGEEDDPAVPHPTTPASGQDPADPNQRDPTLGPPREPRTPTPMPAPPPSNPAPPGQSDPTSPGR